MVPRVLCKTAEGLVIAVCGTPGHMENLECVRQAELPFTMTVERRPGGREDGTSRPLGTLGRGREDRA